MLAVVVATSTQAMKTRYLSEAVASPHEATVSPLVVEGLGIVVLSRLNIGGEFIPHHIEVVAHLSKVEIFLLLCKTKGR